MKKINTLAILISLSCASALAYSADDNAPNNKRKGPPSFDYLDANDDGVITLVEFEKLKPSKGKRTSPEKMFSRFDHDNSGSITEEEYLSHIEKRRKARRNNQDN